MGQSIVNGAVYINPTTFASQGTSLELFVGRVRGCGTGTFVVHYPLFSGGASTITTKAFIVEGSGTGELEGISGSVEATYTPGPNGATSTVTFKIRCRPAASTPPIGDASDS